MSDNASLLTSGNKVYARKRKARKDQVEEIVFDSKDRRSFLTGFRKRKQERKDRAIAQAKEREREEKLELRKEKRSQQKELLAEKIRANNIIYGRENQEGSGDESEQNELSSDQGENVDVLEGDQSITTVVVTKDFDIHNADRSSDELDATPQELVEKIRRNIIEARSDDDDANTPKRSKTGGTNHKKTKQKKFRYETKAKRRERNDKTHSDKKKRGKK